MFYEVLRSSFSKFCWYFYCICLYTHVTIVALKHLIKGLGVTCTMPWIVMSGEVGFWVTTATVNMLVVSANSL